MIKIANWRFVKKNMPIAERVKLKNQLKIFHIAWVNPDFDPDKWRFSDTALITGDAACLADDLKRFEDWGADHDVYCINRSLLFMQRPVRHWAAIDAEESMWFSENLKQDVIPPGGRILRHTIGWCPFGYDIFWKVDQPFENERQKDVWSGNSGYFGILSALKMGYKKVVLAGMPLDTTRCWYEPEGTDGPNWVGQAYRTWMDFKMERPEAAGVRSMGGYSAFIFGKASKQWLTS